MFIYIVFLSAIPLIFGESLLLPFQNFGYDLSRGTLVAMRNTGLLYLTGPEGGCRPEFTNSYKVYNASSNRDKSYNFQSISGCDRIFGTTIDSENLAIFLSFKTVEIIKGTQTNTTTSTFINREGLIGLSSKKLAFFYGYNNPKDINNIVEVYNFNSNAWFNITLSTPRNSMGVTVMENNGLAFFAGGQNENLSVEYNNLDIYNANTNTVITKQLSSARTVVSANALGNKAFFAGGIAGGGHSGPPTLYATVDIYDVVTNSFSTTILNPPRLLTGTMSIDTVGVYFIGGFLNKTETTDASNVINIYKPDGSWTNFNAPYPFVNMDSNAVALPNQKLIFLKYNSFIMVLGMCSPGSYISVNPSTCLTCPQGYYCDGVNISPMICPSGTICNAGSSFPQSIPAPAPAPAPPSGPTPASAPSTSNTASNDCSGLSCYGDSKSIGIGIVVGLFGISFPLLLIYLISGTRRRLRIIRSAGLPVTFKRLVFMYDLQFDDMKSMTAVTSKN